MNELLWAHASSADSGTDTSPRVCMARRPAAVREQRSTQLGTFSPCLFCMLLKPWLWGMFNDWFIWENNTGEMTSPSFNNEFFTSLTNLFPWNLHSCLLSEQKKASLCPWLPLHTICLACIDRIFRSTGSALFPMSSSETQWRIQVMAGDIFGEQLRVWLTLLFCAAVRSWNNWHN